MTASRDKREGKRGSANASTHQAFEIARERIEPGTSRELDLPVARLPTRTSVDLPLVVRHGTRPGPCVWISSCVHGDELNGIEIIRQVLAATAKLDLAGTLLAVPVVNVFGFIHQSRYLPDRRDLNRSFPGSPRGSLASRMAHLFLTEIVARCSHGIDLHTGSNDRANLPQIRADLDDPETLRCAEAFGAPVMMSAKLRDGSLRAAATKRGIPVLLYEAGEALRFDDDSIAMGTAGVLRVLHSLGMLESAPEQPASATRLVEKASWVRARRSGLARLSTKLGDRVAKDDVLGILADPFGSTVGRLRAPFDGVVLGLLNNPVVNRGDAVINVGQLD
ncbi:MAG: deacylase [Planctomycetota bacterium]|nr:MAG: deacylase [Planctomycetota bacterium]